MLEFKPSPIYCVRIPCHVRSKPQTPQALSLLHLLGYHSCSKEGKNHFTDMSHTRGSRKSMLADRDAETESRATRNCRMSPKSSPVHSWEGISETLLAVHSDFFQTSQSFYNSHLPQAQHGAERWEFWAPKLRETSSWAYVLLMASRRGSVQTSTGFK